MQAECYYRRKKNIYDADKEKVHRDQTLGNTGGNNNKDAMFDWRSGCQSEDKCNCHIHLTSTMIRRVGGGVRRVRTNPLWRSIMED